MLDIVGRDLRSGSSLDAASTTWATPSTTWATPSASSVLDFFPSSGTLFSIQPSIFIEIKLFDQFPIGSAGSATGPTGTSSATTKAPGATATAEAAVKFAAAAPTTEPSGAATSKSTASKIVTALAIAIRFTWSILFGALGPQVGG